MSLTKSANLVSVPGCIISSEKIADNYFIKNISPVTLNAVGCTGCVHHNGAFTVLVFLKILLAEFFHENSEMLRHHQTRLWARRIGTSSFNR